MNSRTIAAAELLGITLSEAADMRDLHELIKDGFNNSVVGKLKKETGLTLEQIMEATGIAQRTFQRRIASKQKLNAFESERLLALAEVIVYAAMHVDVEDGTASTFVMAANWLRRKVTFVDSTGIPVWIIPLEALSTVPGCAFIMKLIDEKFAVTK